MDTKAKPYVHSGYLMTHVVNPIVVRLGLAATLTVRGRTTGRMVTTPMGGPFEFDGGRYLVSGRGETHWVRNVRAAGRATFTRHGRTETFRSVEISGPERERIVAAWRRKLGHSVDGLFEQIPDPADHPVFRLDPDTPGVVAAPEVEAAP